MTARQSVESATWTMRVGEGRLTCDKRTASRSIPENSGRRVDQQLNDTMPLVVCGPGWNRDRCWRTKTRHQRPSSVDHHGVRCCQRSLAQRAGRELLANTEWLVTGCSKKPGSAFQPAVKVAWPPTSIAQLKRCC